MYNYYAFYVMRRGRENEFYEELISVVTVESSYLRLYWMSCFAF